MSTTRNSRSARIDARAPCVAGSTSMDVLRRMTVGRRGLGCGSPRLPPVATRFAPNAPFRRPGSDRHAPRHFCNRSTSSFRSATPCTAPRCRQAARLWVSRSASAARSQAVMGRSIADRHPASLAEAVSLPGPDGDSPHASLNRHSGSRPLSLPRRMACRFDLFSITPASHRATVDERHRPPIKVDPSPGLLVHAPSCRPPDVKLRSACEHRPRRARVLVRQRHRRDGPAPPLPGGHDPAASPVGSSRRPGQDRPRPVDQQRAQVAVATLADPEQRRRTADSSTAPCGRATPPAGPSGWHCHTLPSPPCSPSAGTPGTTAVRLTEAFSVPPSLRCRPPP